jgi:F-type H+-transporting ATPase subunit alpha
MERAFKLNEAHGGGSVTALPIIETQQGDIASFISTNLISMTDGQLYLDTALFTQAQLPAIDIGRSVSRVGRDAQPGAMRDAAANLRLEIAQYEEVKGFARFGAILDEATRAQIARGERLTRVLGQRERQVVPLDLGIRRSLLDDLAPAAVPEFERHLAALAPVFAEVGPQVAAAPSIGPELARDLRRWTEAAKDRLGSAAG